jgi:glucose-1-phosphate thymidylyltransferase
MRRPDVTGTLDAAQGDAAARGIKAMIPDNRGRPFLDHVLASLADAGISDVCVVIGPDHDEIRHRYMARRPTRLHLQFAVQQEATGTARALQAAEPWCAGRDFMVLNADNLYPVDAMRRLAMLDGPGFVAFDRDALIRESNIDAARIGAFAIMTLRPDGSLQSIVEKPGADSGHSPAASLVSMNIWRFDGGIFDCCRDVRLSPRGEYELPLAVALAVDRGMILYAVPSTSGVLDLSNRGDISAVSRRLGEREVLL